MYIIILKVNYNYGKSISPFKRLFIFVNLFVSSKKIYYICKKYKQNGKKSQINKKSKVIYK